MKRRTEKKAVWKDTNKYPFSIRYEYPLAIKSRCLFFWADTLKGWRAVINLADKLADKNKVCVVYLFGEAKEEILQRHIKKLESKRVVVLWANCVSTEQIENINNAISDIDNARGWGARFDKLEIEDIFNFDYEKELREHFIASEKEQESIGKGKESAERAKANILKCGYKNISDGSLCPGQEEAHITYLFKIIEKIYPYGAEADAKTEYAYKVAHFEKWCEVGLNGDYESLSRLGVTYQDSTAQYFQLTLFDDTSWGIREFVNEFRKICDAEIEKNGYFVLSRIMQKTMEPPYGMYECNYYGLCIGIALRKYAKGYYLGHMLQTQYTEEANISLLTARAVRSLFEKRRHEVYFYAQSEKQVRLAKKLIEMFPYGYEFSPKCICLQNVLTSVRDWIQRNVRYDTIQRDIPELFGLVNLWEPEVYSKDTEKYAEWLTDENAERVMETIENTDKRFLERLSQKYGEEKALLYKKGNYIKGGAIGWLHETEQVDERVEWYMKETVCRECGAVFANKYKIYENDDAQRGKTKELTKQNIINLNKKLLGRYQNESFCLNCLCEVVGMTQWELYEKMLSFKEQGCELF